MLEEIKKEVSTIKLLSKYRRPLWDERGLARLFGGEDSKAEEGQPVEVGRFYGEGRTNYECQILG